MLSEVLIWAEWPVELCWSGPQFEPENGSPQSQTDRCFMDLYSVNMFHLKVLVPLTKAL